MTIKLLSSIKKEVLRFGTVAARDLRQSDRTSNCLLFPSQWQPTFLVCSARSATATSSRRPRQLLRFQVSQTGGSSFFEIPSVTTDSPEQALTQLLYVPEVDSKLCYGYVGESRSKFCISNDCLIQNHKKRKFIPKPGLYIRVPRKLDQVYCQPHLSDELFYPDLAAEFLSQDRTVEEWSSIFAQITNNATKLNLAEWNVLKTGFERGGNFQDSQTCLQAEDSSFSSDGVSLVRHRRFETGYVE